MCEWERFAEVPGMREVQRTEIPASDVIWVSFICSVSVIRSSTTRSFVVSHWFVNHGTRPNVREPMWRE
jgi:hypothetical protein